MTDDRVQAPYGEGAGYRIPPRDPAHENPEWFQLGTDEDLNDPDGPFVDPLPTERHRQIPEVS